jgi:hypothetical protein
MLVDDDFDLYIHTYIHTYIVVMYVCTKCKQKIEKNNFIYVMLLYLNVRVHNVYMDTM